MPGDAWRPRLGRYLKLEIAAMKAAQARDDDLWTRIAEVMDRAWWHMDQRERDEVNRRAREQVSRRSDDLR